MRHGSDLDSAEEEEAAVVEKTLQVAAELHMDSAVSFYCLFESQVREVLAAAIAVVAVGSVAAKLVYVAVAVESVGSFVLGIVEPIPEYDLISYRHPYQQKSMAPLVEESLRLANLVVCFAQFCVDPGAKFPVSSAPLPASSCPLQLWLGANYASTHRVQSIVMEELVDYPKMLYLAVLDLEVQNSSLEELAVLYENCSYCLPARK